MCRVFSASHTLGHAVSRLDGDVSGFKRPEKPLLRYTPFTVLPDEVLSLERWLLIESGTWQMEDHITLGESRAVVRLARRLVVSTASWHRMTVLSLEDNMAAAGSLGKGRSPAPSLNRLCRQLCAAVVAGGLRWLLPWVETLRQPADPASRF